MRNTLKMLSLFLFSFLLLSSFFAPLAYHYMTILNIDVYNQYSEGVNQNDNISQIKIKNLFESNSEMYENQTLTRKQAVINFIAGLQLKDGGFVTDLGAAEEGEGVADTTSAIKTLSFLDALNAVDTNKIIDFISKRQTKEGGFIPSLASKGPGGITVSYAVAYILGHLNAFDRINKTGFLEWVLGCYHSEDGRFAGVPKIYDLEEYESGYWVFHTVMGVLALYWMNELDKIDVKKTIDYIMSCYREDGGFSSSPQMNESNVDDTRWCLVALDRLNALNRIDKELTIGYILNFYDENSQMFAGLGAPLTASAYGVEFLGILGALNRVNITKIVDFVLSCQSPLHGGFVGSPEDILEESEEGIGGTEMAVQILYTLNALDRLNETIVVTYKPIWHGRPYVPHSNNEPTNQGSSGGTNITGGDAVVIFLVGVAVVWIATSLRKSKKHKKRIKYSKIRVRKKKI